MYPASQSYSEGVTDDEMSSTSMEAESSLPSTSTAPSIDTDQPSTSESSGINSFISLMNIFSPGKQYRVSELANLGFRWYAWWVILTGRRATHQWSSPALYFPLNVFFFLYLYFNVPSFLESLHIHFLLTPFPNTHTSPIPPPHPPPHHIYTIPHPCPTPYPNHHRKYNTYEEVHQPWLSARFIT